ncbi:unnamed protein product, partial [marine sediment metagenome]
IVFPEQTITNGFKPNSQIGIVSATSFDLEDERNIGYEFLDDNKVVHIWNTNDDYFFNKSSGIQFTNHYQDYWTRNIFCIGYYDGDEWNKIKCADELEGFNREIHTDNSTYVNATLWKNINYGSYDLRFGVQYYFGLNDENLSVTIYGKNIGIDIPFDLGFAWKITDVEIPPNFEEDSIRINDTGYYLDGSYDLLFKDLVKITPCENSSGNCTSDKYEDIPYFVMRDKQEFLRLDWNKNLNYAVKMYGNGNQEDFYTMILINAGHFNPNQEKSTTLYWIDAIGDFVSSWDYQGLESNTIGFGCEGEYCYIFQGTDKIFKTYENGTNITSWGPLLATEGNDEGYGLDVYNGLLYSVSSIVSSSYKIENKAATPGVVVFT